MQLFGNGIVAVSSGRYNITLSIQQSPLVIIFCAHSYFRGVKKLAVPRNSISAESLVTIPCLLSIFPAKSSLLSRDSNGLRIKFCLNRFSG